MTAQLSRFTLVDRDGYLFTYRDSVSGLFFSIFFMISFYNAWILQSPTDDQTFLDHFQIRIDEHRDWEAIAAKRIDDYLASLPPSKVEQQAFSFSDLTTS
ncbi:MAG: hypothetical protein KME43_11315 [Myxacorys chilensis ATA2-1-KO14]|jgi:hypothetical protein|nr:hypothetical protein [Myxacorys chilensis ATA2-1-KO14]